MVLRRQFTNEKYYQHFVRLVQMLNVCLQIKISDVQLEALRDGFVRCIIYIISIIQKGFQRILSQFMHVSISRQALKLLDLSGVLGFFRWSVTVVCFNLPSVIGASLSHPLDRHVLEDAQLTQIKTIYDKAEALALKEPSFHGPPRKSYEHPDCMD